MNNFSKLNAFSLSGDDDCPCGSGKKFAACCGPLVAMDSVAKTAEALMRSRYTAYVMGNINYLRQTWHKETCPAELSHDPNIQWQGLEVRRVNRGMASHDRGEVEFIASYTVHGKAGCIHENSRFVKFENQWLYVDGELKSEKTGRNDPCPCGSGKKYKKCCAAR